MSDGFTLNGFVMRATPKLFLQYCQQSNIPIKVKKDLTEEEVRDKIVEQIRGLDEETRSKLEFGLQQIYVLAPNEGSHTLVEESIARKIDFPKEEIDGYDSQDKALWFYLNKKEFFDEIAAWQEVNDKQGWKELVGLKKTKVKNILGKETVLRDQLSTYLFDTQLRGKNCAVECYKQKNRVCYVAYPEGYTESVFLYKGSNFKKGEPFKPVDKIFFLYHPKTGKLSTKASGGYKTIREYQKIFGRAVLGEEINVDSDRVFNLDILKNKNITFPTPPEDEIEYVKVKALNIRYFGGTKKVRLEVNGENDGIKDVHDLMDELRINPGGISISKAEFQIKFPSEIAHSSGSLTFYISWPNSHNINDNPRYSKAKGYLKKWGLEQSFEEILDKVFNPSLIQKATTFELDKSLTSSVRYWLRDNKIISEEGQLKEWFCDDCNASHTIQFQGKGYFYDCKGNKTSLSKYDIQLWKFNYARLIKCLADNLELNSPTKEIISDKIWQVGKIKKDKETIDIFYNKDVTIPQNIAINRAVIINPNETKQENEDILFLSLGDFVNLNKKGVSVDKDYFEQIVFAKFKPVIFRNNGDLLINGRVLVSTKPTTPEYYFLECLWSDFDQPKSHEYIHEYCGKQLAKSQGLEKWQDSSSDQDYCNKRKSAIFSRARNKMDKDLLDQVIQKTRTQDRENAYRLTNPQ